MGDVVSGMLVQIFCYAGLMIVTIMGMGMLLKGFFFKYLKVRTSFGKNVLVKVRTPIRDYFMIGWVEENFLCYKNKKFTIRIAINTQDKVFYRCMGIAMIDVDEEKNSVCHVDYSTVTGFDAKKHSDLLTRALMRPAISSNQEKILLACVIGAIIVAGVAAFLAYQSSGQLTTLTTNMPIYIENAVKSALTKFTGGISGNGVVGINATVPILT